MTIEQHIRDKRKTAEGRRRLEDEVKAALSVSDRHFIRLKKGQTPLTLEKAVAVAEVLKVPAKQLLPND